MDELEDDQLAQLIERLRLWLFDESPTGAKDSTAVRPALDANPSDEPDIDAGPHTTVRPRDAPAVRHDRGG